MRKAINLIILFVIIISLVCIQSPCFAQNMLRKFSRGVANIATGPFEILKSIQESFYEDGPIAAGSYGVVDGVYKCLLRTIVGAYEVITFPIPFPAHYEHIVEPEFLFSPHE